MTDPFSDFLCADMVILFYLWQECNESLDPLLNIVKKEKTGKLHPFPQILTWTKDLKLIVDYYMWY